MKKEFKEYDNFPACVNKCPAIFLHKEKKEELDKELKRLNKLNTKLLEENKGLKSIQKKPQLDSAIFLTEPIQTCHEEIKMLKTRLNESQKENDILRKNIVELLNFKKTFKRQQKYNAKKVTIDGITFASIREGKRYTELKYLKQAGLIKSFDLQPEFLLSDGAKKIKYFADFRVVYPDGRAEIEDVKGFKKDKYYRLKFNLMKNIYNIDIKEI